MAYSDGNIPKMGDKVRDERGKVGTVIHVQLDAPNTPGHDIVGIEWDDDSVGVGMSLAAEYALISRQ